MPDCWKKSVIFPVFKKKDRLSCDNYTGISLLPHCEKLLASIIFERIRRRTDQILSEAQAGFRGGRRTVDQLFTLRRMSELYTEYGKHLYVCYVDFKKAFDSRASSAWENILRFSQDYLRSTLAGHFQSHEIGGNAQLAACC